MRVFATVLSLVLLLLVPTAAQAYVGPGAGLSLLGALWALIAALGTAIVFIVAWPVRNMLRKRRSRLAQREQETGGGMADASRAAATSEPMQRS